MKQLVKKFSYPTKEPPMRYIDNLVALTLVFAVAAVVATGVIEILGTLFF